MQNSVETKLKSDKVPVFINDELVMLDRLTLITLKATAYDEGRTLEAVFSDAITAVLSNPEKFEKLMGESTVGGGTLDSGMAFGRNTNGALAPFFLGVWRRITESIATPISSTYNSIARCLWRLIPEQPENRNHERKGKEIPPMSHL